MTQPRHIPLCHAQRRVFFSEAIAPGTGVGNLAGAVHWQGDPADLPRLHAAIHQVVRRHDALRLRLVAADGPLAEQVLGPPPEVEAPVWDLGEDRAPLLEESHRPFTLYDAPLYRFRLLRLPAGRIGYFFTYHLIFIDAWSVSLLNRQILAAFRGDGGSAAVPSFLEFLERERAWLDTRARAEEEAFWQAHFAGLPLAAAGVPRGSIASRRYGHTFDPALSARIVALANEHGTTVFRFLLALFALHLTRLGRQEEVVLATEHDNRLTEREREMAGMLVSTVPMRLGVRRGASFADLLRGVHATSTACLDRQRFPYDLLSQHLRAQGHDPVKLLACTVNHTPRLPGGEGDGDLVVERYSPGANLGELDIEINPNQRPGAAPLELAVEARTALHGADSMRSFFARIEHLAREVVARPVEPIGALARLPARERAVVIGPERSPGGDLPAAFLAAAARWPDRPALVGPGGPRSYSALLAEVEGLAGRLQATGVRPGDRVAVICGRTAAYVVSLLAVLRAGAAWVPIPAETPPLRVARILADAGARLALVDRPQDLPVPAVPVAGEAAPFAPVAIDPEQDAYVLFTSGSTGTPKGVRVPHRAVANMAAWSRELWELTPADRVAAFCSFAFDVSVGEILVPLLAGAALVMVPEEARHDVCALARFYERHGVTVSFLPTRVGELFMDHTEGAGLRLLLVAGEALRPRKKPPYRLINAYGPTEACVYCCAWEVRGGERELPIGHPAPNAWAYVVDEDGELAARGEPGELWLAGDPVARGYLGDDPGGFGPNPFAVGARDGWRYRTGDLVRVGPDGALTFLGRQDRQIKLRGFRIEPAEIEACLNAAPGVRGSAVLPQDGELTAFVAPRDHDLAALRAHTQARLPEHMVPARFVGVPAIPLTPSGKTDTAALLARAARPAPPAPDAPRDPREAAVLALFRRVLGRADLGVGDAFFDHGGDSLKAMELFARIERELGVALSPALVFRNPTAASLARAVSAAATAETRVPLTRGPGPQLHCVHDFTGDLMAYTHLVCALDETLQIHGLRWAGGLAQEATTLQDLARGYLEQVRAEQPAGPYRLLGYSIGGTIAWEMARQLGARGESVALLCLVDTPNYAQNTGPFAHFPRWASRSTVSWFGGMSRTLRLASVTTGLRWLYARQRLIALVAAQRRMRALAQRYRPGPLSCPVLLLRSHTRRRGLGPDLGWGALAPALDIVEIGGDHITILDEPHAAGLARAIRDRTFKLA